MGKMKLQNGFPIKAAVMRSDSGLLMYLSKKLLGKEAETMRQDISTMSKR